MTVTIGYVGLDHHHRTPYLDSIARLDDAEVVATADPYGVQAVDVGAESLLGLPHYESTAAMLANESIDVVWLTLSNRDTPAAIDAALDAGVDVYSEKPAARTAADLAPVADRIRAADDRTVCFSYTWRAHPIAQQLREHASNDFFGDVRGFDLRFVASALETRDTDHYLFDRDASRGGIVQWLGVHWIDLLPWLLDDEIVRVNAAMSATHPDVDVENGAALTFELGDSGAVGTLTTGYHLREGRYDTEIAVYGTDGRCWWDPIGSEFGFDGQTTLHLDSDDWPSTPTRDITYEYDEAPGYGGKWGLAFFEQFLAARDGDETATVPASVDDALGVLSVLDAAYESNETGEWVTVDRPTDEA
ncbi:Gfo/Idh/MocA family protein [Haloarchaeobius sp. TZWSO28]|uniref:Gfo/Idh/MocA family protein n=1 Tax=Haloarchaeobius sp. TZWSO28 TaxID=3446119 RepID=UPI003EB98F45